MAESVALLLAAGRSSRMGAEKLFLPWGKSCVLRATAEEILGAGFSRVLVVCGENAAKARAALAGLPVEFVVNPHAATGMHSSIRAGLLAAGPVASFLVCLGDQPAVPAALYAELRETLGDGALAAPLYAERRGNPVAIAGRLIPEILAHPDDDRGCAYLFRAHPARFLETDDASVTEDLDTPEDYARLRAGAP